MGRWARLALTLTVLAAVAVVTVSLTSGRHRGDGRCHRRSGRHAVVDRHPGRTRSGSTGRDRGDQASERGTGRRAAGRRGAQGPRVQPDTPASRWAAVLGRPCGGPRWVGWTSDLARRHATDLHGGVRRSTVNPYIWYLHRCKISTGCATKVGSCPQDRSVAHRWSTSRSTSAGSSTRAHRFSSRNHTNHPQSCPQIDQQAATMRRDEQAGGSTCDVRSVVTRTPG